MSAGGYTYHDELSDDGAKGNAAGVAALINYAAFGDGSPPPTGWAAYHDRTLGSVLEQTAPTPPSATPAAPRQRSLRERFETMKARVAGGDLLAFKTTNGCFEFLGRDAVTVATALGIVLATRPDGEGGAIALCMVPGGPTGMQQCWQLLANGIGNVAFVSFDQLDAVPSAA
jgi:hypothetical protein